MRPSCFPGCVLEVVVIGLDAWPRKRFPKKTRFVFGASLHATWCNRETSDSLSSKFPTSVSTSTITTDRERTYPWRKTRRNNARFNRLKSARSWHYLRSVDCITATNDKQPEITGTYSRFLVDHSAASAPARPHVLRIY